MRLLWCLNFDVCICGGACGYQTKNHFENHQLHNTSQSPPQFVNARQVLEPWGMLYQQSNNSLVLTDPTNHSIKMIRLDETRKCSRVFTMYQSNNDRPTGIATTRSGSFVVADSGGRINRLGVYVATSNVLEKRFEFAARGHGDGEVALANYIAVDHQDRVIVSDVEAKQVRIMSLEGHQLLKFSCSCSFDGSKEMEPQGVAVDDSNNILVADQAMKGVGMFSSEGALIGHVASTKGKPWGLAYLDHLRLLAVATSFGLEMFEL